MSIGGRSPRAIHPDLVRSLPRLVEGHGVEVRDEDGKWLLDAAAGVGVLSLGYSVPEIVRSIEGQAARLPFVHAMRFDSDPPQDLARELSEVTPPEIRDYFFCSGGSEAVESAMKIALQYHIERGERSRFRFVGRWQSFHGNTLATQSVGGHVQRRRRQAAVLIDFPHIEAPNCYRCEDPSHDSCGQRFADHLRLAIERAGPETIAGFVMETVSGATSGALVPPPEYLERVRRVCDDYGILLILDEIYTSLGRTGRNYAFEHWGVLPDLVTMGKGVGGGFVPIGVVGIRDEVVRAFERGSGVLEHNFTFASHPVSCAAAATAVRIMREMDVAGRAARAGRRLREGLETLRERPTVGDIRGLGLLVGVEFVEDRRSKRPFPAEHRYAARLTRESYERGLLVYPGSGTVDGIVGDHILLTPPLVISDEDIDRATRLLGDAIVATESHFQMAS